MFKDKTVLILGAGATADFGYPTGEELTDCIHRFKYFPFKENITEDKFNSFNKRVTELQPIMIDLFLSHNPDFEDVGKVLIAYDILHKEKMSEEYLNQKENWYRYLLDAITQNCYDRNSLLENNKNLSIVTFNYDISLEYYLYSRFKMISFFKDYVDDFLKNIGIIHVYGQLGCFDWHKKHCDNMYGKDLIQSRKKGNLYGQCTQLYNEFSKSIQVIGTNKWKNKAPKHIEIIKKIVLEAEKIYILGFGFYDENIELIGLDKVFRDKRKKIYYSNYNDYEKINRKIYTLAEYIYKKGNRHAEIENYNIKSRLIKSTKKVYRAVSEDFDFLE